MPKRKKISLASEDSKDSSDCSKQRKFLDPLEMCHELYETIRNHKSDDGRLICESFIRTPNRRSLPDYYDIVTSPIDLMKIQQKLKTEEYVDVNQFSTDIELIVNNTKSYYKKSSQEYKDACEIWEIFVETRSELLSADHRIKDEDKSSEFDDDRGSECSEDDSAYEELFTTVMTAADMEGRPLSTMFQLLPSRTKCDLAMTPEVNYCTEGQTKETYHFKILIPSVAAGAIIGKKGKTIELLQKEAGAVLKMSKTKDFYPGTTERVCLISGSVESILKMLQFIMEKVKEKLTFHATMSIDSNGQPIEREKQVKILVPNTTASMVIGQGGKYIKKIAKKSGAYVQISQKHKIRALAERCITVIGEIDENKIACRMILAKIVEDPQSCSCLNISYTDVTGPVANSNYVGSSVVNLSNIPRNAINSNLGYSNNDKHYYSNSTVTNNNRNPDVSANHSKIVPFIGIDISGSMLLPVSVPQIIQTTKTVLGDNGFSQQAVSEVIAAVNTLANHGLLRLGKLKKVNGSPEISELGLEMSNSVVTNYTMPHQDLEKQNLFTATDISGMEDASNSMNMSCAMEARSNMFSPASILVNRMSGLDLGQEFYPPITYPSNNCLVHAEPTIFEPFQRASPALASPSAAALPMNNNSFGLGTDLISGLPTLRSAFSGDQQVADTVKIEIEVGENIFTAILQTGGKTLLDIEQFSGANIQISNKGMYFPATHIITITGTSNAVNSARCLIEQKIENALGALL